MVSRNYPRSFTILTASLLHLPGNTRAQSFFQPWYLRFAVLSAFTSEQCNETFPVFWPVAEILNWTMHKQSMFCAGRPGGGRNTCQVRNFESDLSRLWWPSNFFRSALCFPDPSLRTTAPFYVMYIKNALLPTRAFGRLRVFHFEECSIVFFFVQGRLRKPRRAIPF